jgi:thioredoxin 1
MRQTRKIPDARFGTDRLKAPGPGLVDFRAAWCGPCTMIAPIAEDIAMSMEGKATIAKLDIDENPIIQGKYGIPTPLPFRDGRVVVARIGAPAKAARLNRVEASLAGGPRQ